MRLSLWGTSKLDANLNIFTVKELLINWSLINRTLTQTIINEWYNKNIEGKDQQEYSFIAEFFLYISFAIVFYVDAPNYLSIFS